MGCPCLRAAAWSGVRSRSLGAHRDVRAREPLLGGVGKRATHDEMNFVDRLGSEPITMLPAARAQRGVEVVQVFGADRPERIPADGRNDVALDHPPVPVRGGGTDSTLAFRKPRVSQVVAERHRVSPTRGRHTIGFGDARRDRFGIGARRAGRVPPSALATGSRVDAVIGDDIEAVVARDDVGHASVIGT